MKLGKLIQEYRLEHRYSLREFADLCGISFAQIRLMERGLNTQGKPFVPSVKSLKAVAKGMGISLTALLECCDDMVIEWDADDVEVKVSPANRTLMAWAASLPPEQAETWCKAFGLTVVP